jgi:membrane fusion protein (multidrug efflux system)
VVPAAAAIVLAVAAIILAGASAGCSRGGQTPAQAAAQTRQEPPTVRVSTAESRRVERTLSLTGSLSPDESVQVSAEVAGRVGAIYFDFGQAVKKGQIIAELDKREATLQHDRSRAALAQSLARVGLDPNQEEVSPETTPAIRQAAAQFEDARFKYENAARLIKTGDIAQERFVELEKAMHAREAALQGAKDDLRTQLANIQALRAEVKLAEKRISDATVTAPFDGSIAAKLVSPGQYLKENTPIVTLVKASPLRLRADIPEAAANEVRVGSTLFFTTDAAPGARFQAVIRELNPALESRSRSLTAEARLTSADPRLRPGMFVQVELALARNVETVVVPREALYQIAGLTKIFVVRGSRAAEVKITPGQAMGGWIEAPGGSVHAGDRVAVSGLAMLTDGAEIRPVAAEAGR